MSKKNLDHSYDTGADSDDPELQAEIEYAKEHGLSVENNSVLAAKLRLRKSKSHAADPTPASQPGGVVSVKRSEKNNRRSRAARGQIGAPKKGGNGGKGTWGNAAGDYIDEPAYLDNDDPNYDSSDDTKSNGKLVAVDLSDESVREAIGTIIGEFFANGALCDAIDSIKDLALGHSSDGRSVIVSQSVLLSLDKRASARELCSELLAELVHQKYLTVTSHCSKGFLRLLKEDLGRDDADLLLDYPGAPEVIGNFVARAIADEVLDVDFLSHVGSLSTPAKAAVTRANLMLKQKHRLDNIWGVSAGKQPVRYLVNKIKLALDEYLNANDVKEAGQCLTELEIPHFHHEIVYKAGVMSLESMNEKTMARLAHLLKSLHSTGILSDDAMVKGFERLYGALPEIYLDVPAAYTLLERWVDLNSKLLTAETIGRMPQRGRKRFLSEGDDRGRLAVLD